MESEVKLKDFADIYALCSKHADSFCLIGDHFCQTFRGKDIASVCLTLIACYQECGSVLFVTHRLIIVYLIYRLKDIGRTDDDESETLEILKHPFLLIFVKIYTDYCSKNVPPSENTTGVLHLLNGFPTITPQEAYFIGRILTESNKALKALFRMSPSNVADKSVPNTELDISEHVNVVEEQLSRFRIMGREATHETLCEPKGNISNSDWHSPQACILYSLVLPPFMRTDPSVMAPVEDEFRFIYPPLIAPEQVMDDWLKDEEWKQEKMRPLEKSLISTNNNNNSMSLRSSAPSSPAGSRKQRNAPDTEGGGYGASPFLDAILLQSSKSLSKYSSSNHTNVQLASAQALMSRTSAVECLRKLVSNGKTVTKSEVNLLLLTVSEDPHIFKDACIGDSFADFVEFHPDIAAELLFYEMKYHVAAMTKHFEVLLKLQLSVQSLVAVNKFIQICMGKHQDIPSDFLNRFITHCMASCDQKSDSSNSLMTHRLVRMVCVFFTTLIRLRGFNSKPRLTEMQNFALIFLALKEASNLYQTILSLE